MSMYQNRETVVVPIGGFLTHEKAEAAFHHLLRREKIDETSTWDSTMRKIIMDPLYKSFDELAAKKASYETVSVVEVKLTPVCCQFEAGEGRGEAG
jgi:uncharacterized protein YifN (PemK superfamily)